MNDHGRGLLSIGLMSGTSMDGIDAALLETDGSANLIKELGSVSLPYDPSFKILLNVAQYAVKAFHGDMDQARIYYNQAIVDYLTRELKIVKDDIAPSFKNLSNYLYGTEKSNNPITLDEIIRHSTHLHAVAISKLLKETGYKANQIDVVGYHGQTLLHRPCEKLTLSVGNGFDLAERIGITVINNFREHDVAAGGQGAPLAPLYHHALAKRDKKIPSVIVNCGGISNVSLINSAIEFDLIGFDTGPGNGLIDRLVRQRTQGEENMDANGQYGNRGTVDNKVLRALYEKSTIINGRNYFLEKPPKSLDIGDLELISELDSLSLNDACATLAAFTADSIIQSLELFNTIPPCWILAGGGWNNPVIRYQLLHRLEKKIGKTIEMSSADEVGWNSKSMEAQIFAYLAVRSLQNKPLSLPSTTGVTKPLSGGRAYVPSLGPTPIVARLIQENPAVLLGYVVTETH